MTKASINFRATLDGNLIHERSVELGEVFARDVTDLIARLIDGVGDTLLKAEKR